MYGSVATLPAALQQSDLSFKSGYSPYALDFDGTNDYINCNTSLNGIDSITYSAWIKPEQPSGNYGYIISAGSYTAGYTMFGIGVRHDGSGNDRKLFLYVGTGGILNSNFTFTYGTWYHVAVTMTDSQNFNFYVNGTAQGSYTSPSTIVIGASTPTRIGSYSGSVASLFNGIISNVSIWNAALTSAQVTEIYSEGVPQNLNNHSAYSNLLSWWQLGSNSSFSTNWTVLDEKGTNNGTSVNMTEADIVDGVGSYANGLSSGMGGDEVVGDAPYSTANALSVNMDVEDRVSDTPS